ncbi:MAG: flagellar basal-body rod protein FlgF [Gammaproteobacteria bacterium]|nr:flagellar basal-body rod protein FlgF [Gammaproteobacteria bacterium]
MDRLLYIAMSGAKETMLAQTVNTHNLANANTTGFRADLQAFQSLPVYGPVYPSRVYALTESMEVDFNPGALITTGRDLDVAINGDGWIGVQAPDGNEAYTRAGDLKINVNGLLTTGAGHPVMGNAGPVAIPPFEKIEIGTDGTLSIQPLGQNPNTLAVVDRIKLVNPDIADLKKGDDGLIRMRNAQIAPPDARVGLQAGSLESSNVNSVESMVNMIRLARQFEIQIKMMSTAQENDEATTQLMRIG